MCLGVNKVVDKFDLKAQLARGVFDRSLFRGPIAQVLNRASVITPKKTKKAGTFLLRLSYYSALRADYIL